MSEEIELTEPVRVIRRHNRPLPSFWAHLVRAMAFMVLVAGSAVLAYKMLGNPNDAVAQGETGLKPLPVPAASDSLNGDSDVLPDLLDGDVPQGINPTVETDALGNPIVTPDEATQTPEPAETEDSPSVTVIDGPDTILIDGQPLEQDRTLPASPLPRAPMTGLSRPAPFGPIPTRSEDGRTVVSAYARPFSATAGKKQVAVIVGGLGINAETTRKAIYELPAEVTLAFAAHAQNLQSLVNQARQQGHEVLLELPMESADFDPTVPGAGKTLKATASDSYNIRNLDRLLSRAQGYYAVTNYNGDSLLNRTDKIAPILKHLSDAGLGMIFDRSFQAASLPTVAAAADLPFTQGYTLIDETASEVSTAAALQRLEQATHSRTAPIGVGFAYDSTITTLRDWTDALSDKNIELAPASYALSRSGS